MSYISVETNLSSPGMLTNLSKYILVGCLFVMMPLATWAQSGPGGVRDNTSNVFWLKGDVGLFDAGGLVGQWEDQAASNDADTLTGRAPVFNATSINSIPGANFVSGDILGITNSGTINTSNFTARTVFFVFRTPSSFSGNEVLYEQGDSNDGMIFYIDASGQINAGIYNTTNDYFVQSGALTVSTDYVFSFLFDGGATSIDGAINNSSFGSNNSTAATVIGNTGDISIGDSGDGNQINGGGTIVSGAAPFTGEITEIIYYDVVLNNAEITVINNYLGEKYGIGLTANDRYTESNYDDEVTGIGRQTVGNTHTVSTGSGGEMYLEESGSTLDADDEWVFAGHNGQSHGTTKNEVAGTLSGFSRWTRIWYIEKTTSGSIDLTVSFDTDEAGFGLANTLGTVSDFKLLFTTDPSTVDFDEVSGSPSASFTDGNAKVTFTLTDTDFSDGYYTLGVTEIVNFYSYSSGDWDDPDNWTTDPSGTIRTNPDSRYPNQTTDNVTILNGDEIDLDADAVTSNGGAFTLGDVTINSGGIVDLEGTGGHTFENFTGNGTLSMEGDNYPAINGTDDFRNSGGGTVQLSGSSDFDFNSGGKSTFNSLKIAVTSATVTLRDSLILNGDLIVSTGTFRINDDTDTDIIRIEVADDLIVESTGTITVGLGDASNDRTPETNVRGVFDFHQIDLKGDLSNEGTITLTNINAASVSALEYYEAYPTAGDEDNDMGGAGAPLDATEYGAVELLMTNDTENQLITCNGTCTFYRVEIDKGTDDTYICEINASAIANFNLYGRIAFQQHFGSDETLYENPRALGLEKGTLKLGNNIRLEEICNNDSSPFGGNSARVCTGSCNSDYVIFPDARLWLSGTSYIASEDQEGLHIMGKLQVSENATLTKKAAGKCGLVFDDNAVIEISGGTVNVNQVRTKSNGANPKGTWIHSGGTVTVNPVSTGTGTQNNHALFSMPFSDMSFVMTADDPPNPPQLNIEMETNGTNDRPKQTSGEDVLLQIGIDASNYNVTAGTITMMMRNGTDENHCIINSTIPFWNITLDKEVGHSSEFKLRNVDAGGTATPAAAIQPLIVLNDFRMKDNSQSGNDRVRFDTNGEDMTIGNGFFIEANTYIDTDQNTMTFNGTSAIQRISVEGSMDYGPGGSKNSGVYQIVLSGTSTKRIEGTFDPFVVGDSLVIGDGVTFDDNGFTIEVNGDMYNAGTHSGQGKIELTGGSTAHTVDGDGTGIYGNLELDDANGANLLEDILVKDTLTLTTGIFDIDIHGIILDSDSAGIDGSGFGTTKYFRTAGNASDEGISMYIANDRDDYLFPIGTDQESGTDKYTPVEMSISGANGVDSGYVKISVADEFLPTIDPSETAKLSYYWRVNHSGFTTLPSFSLRINYDDEDIVGNENQYNGGRVLDQLPFTRTEEDANDDDRNNNELVFNGSSNGGAFPGNRFTMENANFSAAGSNAWNGAPEIYYTSYNLGTAFSTKWDQTSSWSTQGHWNGATAASDFPQGGDIAVIGWDPDESAGSDSHWISVDDDISVAQMVFADSVDDGLGNWSQRSVAFRPIVRFEQDDSGGGTLDTDIGSASGPGRLRFLVDCTTCDTDASSSVIEIADLTGDYGDFVEIDGNEFYFDAQGSLDGSNFGVEIPTTFPTEYPDLVIRDGGYFVFTEDIQVNYDLVIRSGGTLRLNDGANGDITVLDDLSMTVNSDADFIEFPTSGTARTLTITDNINMDTGDSEADGDQITVLNGTPSTLEHRLIVGGSITIGPNDVIDLYNGTGSNNNAVLELTGSGNEDYSISSGSSNPDLFRVVVNKGTDQSATFTFNDDIDVNGTNDGTTKSIEIQNGTLVINDAAIDLDLNAGNGDFTIPSTGGLTVASGTVRTSATGTGSGNGMRLNGKLTINGGDAILTGGVSGDNYIEYGTGGDSEIEVSSGNLIVGSQVRRSTLSSTGVLTYNQSGGIALFGVNTSATFENDRGVFELTDGSFTLDITSGTDVFALVDAQANPSNGTFILGSSIADPTVSITSGSFIDFGYDDGTYTTSGSPVFDLNSYDELKNIRIDSLNAGSPSVRLVVNNLDIAEDITIRNAGTLDANGFQVNIAGDWENDATFTPNNNLVIFDGATQSISGTAATAFYDLTINSSAEVSSGASLTANGDFNLLTGSFNDNGNALNVKGDANVETSYTGTGGLTLNSATAAQEVTAEDKNGSISKLVIDNANGVQLAATSGGEVVILSITSEMAVDNGVFNIGDNLLDIEAAATITTTGTFSKNTMIAVNGVKKSDGIQKSFTGASPASVDFTIPLGVPGKYTPVDVSVTTSESASLLFKTLNIAHPSATGPDVLDYYWVITSSDEDLTDFDLGSSITFTYVGSDVNGNINNYANARLVAPNWQKLTPPISGNGINSGSRTITWNDSDLNTNSFTGEYTIGLSSDIPDQLIIYRTVTPVTGNWSTVANWEVSTDGGMNFVAASQVPSAGSQVIVQSGSTINMSAPGDDDQNIFDIQIDGVLNVDDTDGHNFGDISGSGTLQLSSGTLPGGNFDNFFSTTAGTLEFGGAGSYTLPADFTDIKGLVISGGGTKTIPSINYNVGVDGIILQDGTTLNNANNSDLVTSGAITLTNGTFNSGNSTVSISASDFTLTSGAFNGESSNISLSGTLNIDGGTFTSTTNTMTLSGNIDFEGGSFANNNGLVLFSGTSNQIVNGDFKSDKFYDIQINKSAGQVFVGNEDTIAVANNMILTDGRFNTNDSATAAILLCEVVAINKGSYTPGSGFVNGPILVELDNGVDFEFPVGKGTTYKPIDMNTTSGQAGVQVWEVEYYPVSAVTNEAAVDNFDVESGSPIVHVNRQEYWRVNTATPASVAMVTLDISNSINQSEIDDQLLHVVVWDDVGSEWDDLEGSASGTASNASLVSASGSSFSENYYTFGSEDSGSPLPVDLVRFEGNEIDGRIHLAWKTATEINNDHFEIQSSIDGRTFETIGMVDGYGNTSEPVEYSYMDPFPVRGINYYRLKQVDFDGAYELHGTIAVYFEPSRKDPSFEIYPNPGTLDQLTLRMTDVEEQNPIFLQLIDMSGKQFPIDQVPAINGDVRLAISPVTPEGIYFLMVRQNERKKTIRFIINH